MESPTSTKIVLPRALRARLMGPGLGLGFVGPFAPVLTVGGLSILVNGDDPVVLPLGWLFAAALLWIVAVRNWRMSVTLTANSVQHQGWWRWQDVPWSRVAWIEFGVLGRRHPTAVPIVYLHSHVIALSACERCRRRMRLEQAGLLAEAASRWNVPVFVGPGALSMWWWRGADFPVRPDAMRTAWLNRRSFAVAADPPSESVPYQERWPGAEP